MFDHDKFRKDIHNGSKNEDEKTGILVVNETFLR